MEHPVSQQVAPGIAHVGHEADAAVEHQHTDQGGAHIGAAFVGRIFHRVVRGLERLVEQVLHRIFAVGCERLALPRNVADGANGEIASDLATVVPAHAVGHHIELGPI